MNKCKTLIVIIFSLFMLSACGESADSRYDSGYSDGYAEGFNTECEIRATLVEGDWDDKNYSSGYQNGRAAGVAACRVSKRN